MSNRPNMRHNHMGQVQAQQRIDVPIDSLPSFHCPSCGGRMFSEVYELYEVSALVSPTGQPAPIKMPMFLCVGCGLSMRAEEMARVMPHDRERIANERVARKMQHALKLLEGENE